MRIAIIGATGNVGTALLKRAQQARSEGRSDLELVGISRRRPDPFTAPYRDVEWHSVDVGDDDDLPALEQALRGADAVVHLAWLIQPNRRQDLLYRTNVTGTEHMLAAAERAGVGHVVCASSVGAYSAAPKDRRTVEDWPTRGIPGSHYSIHKAEQERLLDRFAEEHPDVTVSRLRPGLTFNYRAGSEIGRYFLGGLVARIVPRKPRLPLIPVPPELIFQAVHSDDVAEAYWRVVDQRAPGAFNIAAEPAVDPNALGWVLNARRVFPLPLPVLRAVVDITWRLRLQVTDAGWIDMAAGAPIMDTTRARTVLGWNPVHSSLESISEVIEGMGSGAGRDASPPLSPRNSPGRKILAD